MSLTYNRTLFTQAGLDPDKPPTTWDEVRADAKTIADKTGVAGYAEMATQNTGGWQLTTVDLRARRPDGDRRTPTARSPRPSTTPATKAALAVPQGAALGRQLDGLHLRLRLGHASTRRSPRARSACSPAAPTSTPPWSRTTTSTRPTTASRSSRSPIDPNAGVLGGGTLAAVNVVTTEDQRDAAVDWIDFYYMKKLLTQDGAVADAKALKANNQPVGVPALPIFDKATYDESQAWIKDYINVPTDQMTPFTSEDLRPAARQRADRSTPRTSTRPSTRSSRRS